ncbi:tyrosine-type recombinase/integrase, partial [Streptomyces sp. NPDC001443]
MGSFFKECGHGRSRWPRCPHLYKIRFRTAAGAQSEESGFATQDAAVERLVELYKLRKAAPAGRSKAERIAKYGAMRFEQYAAEWKAGQRDLAPASVRHLESLLAIHLVPLLGSRRMDTFDHKVVEGFVRDMESNGVGLAAQANAFDKLRAILLDANRLGLYDDNPVEGVKQPQYDPKRVVIPSPGQLRGLRSAGDDAFRLVVALMSGCGMRNGEAFAVNVNNIVADDVYRITEQVNRTTNDYARLKHRKAGEHRDVPLPAHVKETIEWFTEKHGTVEGYLLRHPGDPARPFPHYHIANQWRRMKQSGRLEIPDGMVVYSLRHFFASNCLTHGIPITDVAEWMGHKTIAVTFEIYRHLMPGSLSKAAKLLNHDLT